MKLDDIFLELDLYGYSVVNDYDIDKNIISNLIKSHKNCLRDNCEFTDNNYSGGYLIGWNNKLSSKKNFSDTYLKKFIESNFVSSILNSERFKNYNLGSVFATLDTPKSKHIAQAPHFDRIPNLKFMIYLNDIDASNGAFMLSPGSHNWVKKEFPIPRPPFVSKKFLDKSREIPSVIIEKLSPVVGKAGTIIIFDTDTVHHQGLVPKGETRIIRFHFTPPGRLNKFYSLRERVGTYIKPIKSKFKKVFLLENLNN